MKYIKKIHVIFILIVMGVITLSFNGFHSYPIKEIEITQDLAQSFENREIKILIQKDASQSRTFLFETKDSEKIKGCATYVKSLYSNKWRRDTFYTTKMGILKDGGFYYVPDTQIIKYIVSCIVEGENAPDIIFSQEAKPVMATKMIATVTVLFAWIVGRIIGLKKTNKI